MRRVVVPLLCTGLAAGMGGCAPGSSFVAGRSRVVRLAIGEYSLRPTRVTARAGAVTFVVRNDGVLVHNFVVEHGSTSLDPKAPTVFPGQTARLAVVLPPGVYTLESNVGSDFQLGIHARLAVTRR